MQQALIQETGIPNQRFLGKADPAELGYLNSKHLTAISLFSGAGGAALGINAGGFEVRVFVEWEKAACNTLRGNWTKEGFIAWGGKAKDWGKQPWHQKREPAVLNSDITKLTTEEILRAADLRIGECSLLEGGFPCQGFSTANSRRDGSDHTKDDRNSLYLECVRVIREALPRTFFLENVPGPHLNGTRSCHTHDLQRPCRVRVYGLVERDQLCRLWSATESYPSHPIGLTKRSCGNGFRWGSAISHRR
jgi:hypothetical protein